MKKQKLVAIALALASVTSASSASAWAWEASEDTFKDTFDVWFALSATQDLPYNANTSHVVGAVVFSPIFSTLAMGVMTAMGDMRQIQEDAQDHLAGQDASPLLQEAHAWLKQEVVEQLGAEQAQALEPTDLSLVLVSLSAR